MCEIGWAPLPLSLWNEHGPEAGRCGPDRIGREHACAFPRTEQYTEHTGMGRNQVPSIEESFRDFSARWATLPSGSRRRIAGFEIIHTGYRAGLNRVLCVEEGAAWSVDDAEAHRRLALLRDELRSRAGSYVLFLRSDLRSEALASALRAQRFFHDERLDWICMSRDVPPSSPEVALSTSTARPESVVVSKAADPDAVLLWADVVCDGFELNSTAKRTMFAQLVEHYQACRGEANLLLAHHQGAPAGALALHDTRDATGVFWVATVPAKRRLGVARALMEQAFRHAERGRKSALVLQATPAGRALYESMGFESAYAYHLYLHKS